MDEIELRGPFLVNLDDPPALFFDEREQAAIDLFEPTKRVQVDLNVRVRGNKTYAGYEDVLPEGAPLAVGEQVLIWEPEDDIVTDGTVIGLDDEKAIVYLDVDWYAFRDASTCQSGSN